MRPSRRLGPVPGAGRGRDREPRPGARPPAHRRARRGRGQGLARGISATSPGRTSRTRTPASGCAPRARAPPRHLEHASSSGFDGARRHRQWLVAARRGALHAGPPRARGAPRRRAPRCASAASASSTDSTPRCGRSPPTHRGNAGLASRSCARTTRTTRRPRRRCARPTRSGPSARARVPGRYRPGDPARRRDVRGRAVAGVPAAGAGRRVVHRAAGVQRLATRPLLRAVRARRRRRRGDRGAAVEQQPSAAIPTTSVHEAYPGHHWHLVMRRIHAVAGCARSLDALLQRGLGAVRRARDARAGLLRGADPGAPPPEPRRSSGPPRIVVDTSLHLGEMTFDEAVAFMRDKASRCPSRRRGAEVGRYCWWPTQASSYLTGCLEILASGAATSTRAGSRVSPPPTSRSTCCASSTTRSPRPARCRWASRTGRSWRRSPDRGPGPADPRRRYRDRRRAGPAVRGREPRGGPRRGDVPAGERGIGRCRAEHARGAGAGGPDGRRGRGRRRRAAAKAAGDHAGDARAARHRVRGAAGAVRRAVRPIRTAAHRRRGPAPAGRAHPGDAGSVVHAGPSAGAGARPAAAAPPLGLDGWRVPGTRQHDAGQRVERPLRSGGGAGRLRRVAGGDRP